MNLTIQIVGWNSAHALQRSLATLQTIPASEAQIHYIDNASTDDSVETVRSRLPQARITQNVTNLGFAGGHNAGFKHCTTPFVLVLNPDVVLNWPGIKKLLHYFEDPTVGAIQGKLLRSDGTIDSTGIIQTLSLNGVDRGSGKKDTGQFAKEAELLAVTGACGLYRIAALQAVTHSDGEIFDEDFFAYKEDVDLGWRLKRAGWRNLYVPIVMGQHERSLSRQSHFGWKAEPLAIFNRLQDQRTRYSLRNWVWMLVKNLTLKQDITHELFIDARLVFFVLLSCIYPPFLTIWPEIAKGIPHMLQKRL